MYIADVFWKLCSSFYVSNRVSHETSNTAVVCHQSRYKKLLRNKNFILSTTLYGMFSLTTVGYEDLFPLFASTNIKYKGLGMSTSDIGLLYLITGFTVIIIQFSIIPKIIAKFGLKKVFSVTTLLFSILVFLLPTMAKIKTKIVDIFMDNSMLNKIYVQCRSTLC
nr:protein ZINC INDUCED FACILITATOR-LIKE 1-like [Hydra vulgaris]